jgi:exopolysaccharide biosynthesis polyprenyl glycosylphosphotransferase
MKRRRHEYLLIALDWFSVIAGFLFALGLQSRVPFFILHTSPPYVEPWVLFMIAYAPVIMLIFSLNRLYNINVYLTAAHQAWQILVSLLYAVMGIGLLSYFTKATAIVDSRLTILYFFLMTYLLLVFSRVVVFRSVFQSLAHTILNRRMLIIGAGQTGKRLADRVAAKNPFGIQLTGFLDDDMPCGVEAIPGFKVLGSTELLVSIVEEEEIDEIVVCLENEPDIPYLELLDRCAKTRAMVLVASEQFAVIPQRTHQEMYDDMPVFGVMNNPPYLGRPSFKLIGDILLACIMAFVLLPLFLAIALAIKLNSKGPVLFKQTRIGKDGRPFGFYKFRSMTVSGDSDKMREEKLRAFIREGKTDAEGTTKIVDEKRVTSVGRFIRRTSLDELPQLFNVIKGDMSLVGPRPCLPYEWNNYSEWHKKRLSVTPGCTGVWQVLGRSRVSFRDMVLLDLYYVHNRSFTLDIWLLLKTVPVMLFGTGGR